VSHRCITECRCRLVTHTLNYARFAPLLQRLRPELLPWQAGADLRH